MDWRSDLRSQVAVEMKNVRVSCGASGMWGVYSGCIEEMDANLKLLVRSFGGSLRIYAEEERFSAPKRWWLLCGALALGSSQG